MSGHSSASASGRRGSVASETTISSSLDHTLEFDWDASPYTFRRQDSAHSAGQRQSSFLRHLPPHTGPSRQTDASGPAASPDNQPTDVVFPLPPIAHTGDFHGVLFPTHVEGYCNESESESEDDDVVLVENKSVRDERTVFGRMFSKATVPANQSISANKEDAANAAKAINNITKKPLGPIWHGATQIFFILIFLANLIVTIIDVAGDADPLRFKIPDLVLAFCENIVLVVLWFIFKAKYNKKDDSEKANFLKFQQYFENIFHELLLYPTIIIATLGFVEEKMYEKPDSAMGWIQLILLIIDVIDLLVAQATRIYMIYKFFQDIQEVLDPDSAGGCCGSSIGARLLPRTFFTVVGNTLLFLLLIFVMGCQMNYENLSDQVNYSISYKSGLQMIALIIFPIYSVLMFFISNSYWVIEFLVAFNLKLSASTELQKKVMEAGERSAEALAFAANKVDATTERLDTIREMKTVQKLMYGLSEVYVIVLVFLWEVMLLSVFFTFDAFTTDAYNWALRLTFALVAFVVNAQVLFLAANVNIMIPFVTASMCCYPCAILLCFRVKSSEVNDDEVVYDNDDVVTTRAINIRAK